MAVEFKPVELSFCVDYLLNNPIVVEQIIDGHPSLCVALGFLNVQAMEEATIVKNMEQHCLPSDLALIQAEVALMIKIAQGDHDSLRTRRQQ